MWRLPSLALISGPRAWRHLSGVDIMTAGHVRARNAGHRGQSVYIALGKASAGLGLVAGLSTAFIAMISDRIIQAWSAQKKVAPGLD